MIGDGLTFSMAGAGMAGAALGWSYNTTLVLAMGLLLAGIVLLVGELLLPTHGLLGVLGILCFGGVIGVCFYVNRWLGAGVFLAGLVGSPFLFGGAMKIWAKSPVGRRVILQPLENVAPPSAIKLGQTGIAVTDLRPIGECDFGDLRLEAASELGIIHAGQKVKVVAVANGRPTVRVMDAAATA